MCSVIGRALTQERGEYELQIIQQKRNKRIFPSTMLETDVKMIAREQPTQMEAEFSGKYFLQDEIDKKQTNKQPKVFNLLKRDLYNGWIG